VSVRRRCAVAEKAPCVANPWEDRCVVVDVDDGDADANNPEVRHRSHGHVEPDALLLPVSAFLLPVCQRRRRRSDAVAA